MYQLDLLSLILAYSTLAWAFYFFAQSLLPLKSAISRTKCVLFVAGITTIVICIKVTIEFNLPPTILRIILLTSSNTVYKAFYLCLFEGTIVQKFFVIMRSNFMISFIENLLWLLLILVMGNEEIILIENSGWWTVFITFLITSLVTSYWLYKRKKPDAHKHSITMMFIQEMIIAVYFVVNLVLITETDVISQSYFITLSILLFAYFIIAERKEKENYEFQLNQQKYLLLEEHYEEMESYHEKVRIVKHDMKNHLLNLNSHLQKDDYQQVQKQLTQLVDTYQNEISIGHEAENV